MEPHARPPTLPLQDAQVPEESRPRSRLRPSDSGATRSRSSSRTLFAAEGGVYVVCVEGRSGSPSAEVVVKRREANGRAARKKTPSDVVIPPPRSRRTNFDDGPGDWWLAQDQPSTSAAAYDTACIKVGHCGMLRMFLQERPSPRLWKLRRPHPMFANDTFGFYQLVLRKHACRLRYILHQLNRGELPLEELKKNIEYAALVLETAYMDETRRICEEEDELSEVTPEAVPDEVREWLAATFTSQQTSKRPKPKFKSVANAIRTGIFFEKLFKKVMGAPQIPVPANVQPLLADMSNWDFNIFNFNDSTEGHALLYVGTEMFNRYGFLARFKMQADTVTNFLTQLETGYSRHHNPYHNLVHAGDVTQTTHWMMSQSGFLDCMSDLEVFATIYSALIHDYEHTGHTNNFHVQSGSEFAMLYNDKSVLENHHASSCFRFMKEDPEKNILAGLTKDEYREFRNLVIEIVLATDMSTHFVQVKTMKSMLTLPEGIDKTKAICLIVHCSDISHPAKPWEVHSRWTSQVLAEFFRQGDLESSLGLPYSPLCDRHTTHIADSQIGFIDFIVDPTLMVCCEMLVKMVEPLVAISSAPPEEATEDGTSPPPPTSERGRSSRLPLAADGRLNIPTPGVAILRDNRAKWKEKAAQEEAERKRAAAAAEAAAK